ncbi:MAG: HAMP domain-containing histidine kinase [Planctomycetes bacterium]|nr:HAMP domain-containing histidine kinase [Planctomycetota bacterium]
MSGANEIKGMTGELTNMIPSDDPPPPGSAATRFLSLTQESIPHLMRTPLGTIANYAALLEINATDKNDEFLALGVRIRATANRVVRMLELWEAGTKLALRPLGREMTDVLELARSAFVASGGSGKIQLVPGPAETQIELDAELLSYAWSAYATAVCQTTGLQGINVELEFWPSDRNRISLRLRCGGLPVDAHRAEEGNGLRRFLGYSNDATRLETSMRLHLAHDLVTSHGGELVVAGRPGQYSDILVCLPAAGKLA